MLPVGVGNQARCGWHWHAHLRASDAARARVGCALCCFALFSLLTRQIPALVALRLLRSTAASYLLKLSLFTSTFRQDMHALPDYEAQSQEHISRYHLNEYRLSDNEIPKQKAKL